MILICGCSWGVGEWADSGALSGPGLAQYFSFFEPTVNFSRPGASNTDQLHLLKEFLKHYRPQSNDVCYWIVTDTERCVTQLHGSPSQTLLHALDNFLEQANNLAKQYSLNIQLIGGLCDLNSVDISRFPHLTIAVASWPQMLDPTYPTAIYTGLGNLTNLDIPVRDRKDMLCLAEISEKKLHALDHLLEFQAAHPSRWAHIKLRNYLRPDWSTIY